MDDKNLTGIAAVIAGSVVWYLFLLASIKKPLQVYHSIITVFMLN